MAKKVMILIMLVSSVLLGACQKENQADKEKNQSEEIAMASTPEEKKTIPKRDIVEEKEEKSLQQLQKDALDFPVEILKEEILIQDPELKALCPDLFSVIVKNNTEVDIRDFVIALMAWDSNDLPVKIKASYSFDDGMYIEYVNATDVNLVQGATYGERQGMALDESMDDLYTLKVVIIQYTDFNDQTVYNEAAEEFLEEIEGKTLK